MLQWRCLCKPRNSKDSTFDWHSILISQFQNILICLFILQIIQLKLRQWSAPCISLPAIWLYRNCSQSGTKKMFAVAQMTLFDNHIINFRALFLESAVNQQIHDQPSPQPCWRLLYALLFSLFSLFSIFYWSELHLQTCVALVNPLWHINRTWIANGTSRDLIMLTSSACLSIS